MFTSPLDKSRLAKTKIQYEVYRHVMSPKGMPRTSLYQKQGSTNQQLN